MKQYNGWVEIKDAPLEVLGFIWSPDKNWDNRTDQTGTVHELHGGGRVVSSIAKGWTFTHWHQLLDPPIKT